MPSHALPPGAEARSRRRDRRREARRRLRDWRTWGVFVTVVATAQLTSGIAGHFWPGAHGVGYFAVWVAVDGVLSVATGAALIVVVILAGIVRDRRVRP